MKTFLNHAGRRLRLVLTMYSCLLLFLFQSQAIANSLYPFDTPKQDVQFTRLLRELRCLVCQNQDLADSNASLANDLRNEVYTLVKKGQNDEEIIHYLVKRYGDFILFNPPIKATTLLLWFGPGVFLLLGLIIFWRIGVKRTCDE
jgi:cytochrome c-type biogenesis protein CcmH